ncbi:MAG: hypothetical protein ACYDDF_04025 [Thermoplasmatota archaeon]
MLLGKLALRTGAITGEPYQVMTRRRQPIRMRRVTNLATGTPPAASTPSLAGPVGAMGRRAKKPASKAPSFVQPGDQIRVERRYVVDGGLSGVVDEGRFAGVQQFGTAEHLVLDVGGTMRTIPLASISEIQIVTAPKPGTSHDPSFG